MKNKSSLISLMFISLLLATMLVISGCNGSTGNVVVPIDDGTGGTPTSTGSIKIDSTSPATALVYVDGVYKGATPLTISSLSTGIHTFEIKKTNYITKTVGKSIISGTNTPITVTLSPASTDGTLVISSTPVAGASIYLDGSTTSIGITPTSKTVSAGPHTIKLVKDGYITATETKTVTAGTSTTAAIALTPKEMYNDAPTTGTVSVSSTISGATIYVDEENMGLTPKTLALSTGIHIIRAVKTGYTSSPATTKVSTTAGSSSSVNFVLTAISATGTITITSSEASSSVYVDDTYRGLTTQTLTLPEGSHKIKVTKTGFNDFTADRIITAGTNPQVDAKLTAVASATGVLLISSVPEGAAITIDGVSKGLTTAALQPFTLPVGTHQIKLSKANYGDKIQTVTIVSGQSQTIKPIMISKTEIYDDEVPASLGTLSITTTIGSQIYIDNAQTPLTVSANPTTTRLSVGKHAIKISKPGHIDYTQEVTISGTTITTLNKQLTPTPAAPTTGTLVLLPGSTSVVGATIKIGTVSYGTVSAGPITIPNINAGTYTLTFEKTGYQTGTVTNVVITAGQTITKQPPELILTTPACTSVTEICSDGKDNNCNGQIDENCATTTQTGNIYIQTTQPSTQIYVDGVYRSTTPEVMNYLTTINLPVGTHEFKFIKSGFTTQIQNNYVQTSSNPRIMINLVASSTPVAASGTIVLDTNPQGAAIYIDNVAQVGLTPLTVTLTTGQHTVKYTKANYQDTPQLLLTIVQGANNKMTTALNPSSSSATKEVCSNDKNDDYDQWVQDIHDPDCYPGTFTLNSIQVCGSAVKLDHTNTPFENTMLWDADGTLHSNGNVAFYSTCPFASTSNAVTVPGTAIGKIASSVFAIGDRVRLCVPNGENNICTNYVTSTAASGTEICNNCFDDNCNGQIDENCDTDVPVPLTLYLEVRDTMTYNGKTINFVGVSSAGSISMSVDGNTDSLSKGTTKTISGIKVYAADIYVWPVYNPAGSTSQYKGVAKLTLSVS